MNELILDFVKFNPGQGNGDARVSVYSEKHTGRIKRTGIFAIESEDGSVKKELTVNQDPSDEFVLMQENISVQNTASVITINGYSNSSKLKFSLGDDLGDIINIQAPQIYIVNGIETQNDSYIEGDPGALSQYEFFISIEIPENTSSKNLTRTIIVTDESGNTAHTIITQSSSISYIDIDKDVINLDVEGTAQILNIFSNSDWVITKISD